MSTQAELQTINHDEACQTLAELNKSIMECFENIAYHAKVHASRCAGSHAWYMETKEPEFIAAQVNFINDTQVEIDRLMSSISVMERKMRDIHAMRWVD